MELILIGNNFVKMFTTILLTYFIYIKSINYKYKDIKEKVFMILCSINISILYVVLIKYFSEILVTFVLYIIYGLIINNIVKVKQLDYNIIGYIFSCVMSYTIYLIGTLASGIIWIVILNNREHTNPISLLLIPSITSLVYFLIFKRTRFKNGFNFLNKKRINKNVRNFVVLCVCIIIIIFCYPRRMEDLIFKICLLIGSMMVAFNLIIWIKSQITKTYKSKMRDRTIEIQKTEIDEKNKMIEEIKTENLRLATAIHKYNHKFEALELAMKNAIKLESKTEFAKEISIILKEVEETSRNFAEATKVNMVKLPETNITGIDNMFRYMQEEARKNNINYDLKINTSINPLIDNIIPKEKFEILIGDHLKDAIIAVNSSEKSYKSILVILGLVDGIYEFSVYDTGIEFEIDTLLKLGKEQVTTHKETGGSGIGFMTTFETLKESKASLVIEEYNPETTSYTKSVTIRFDGKNKYKICSYRAEKIKEQKTKRRIIIQKLK